MSDYSLEKTSECILGKPVGQVADQRPRLQDRLLAATQNNLLIDSHEHIRPSYY